LQAGEAPTRKLTHARIFLKTDCGEHGPAWQMSKICEAFDVSTTTVTFVRKNFVEGDLEKALECKKHEREYRRRIDRDGWKRVVGFRRISHACAKSIGKHWCLVFVAYLMLHLDCLPSPLAKEQVPTKSIGKTCH